MSLGQEMNLDFYPESQTIPSELVTGVGRDFGVLGLERRMKEAKQAFFFERDFATTHNIGTYMLQSTVFVERDDWADGRRDSAQGVYFGELHVAVDDGSEFVSPIACKPFRLFERHRAIHEYVANEMFKDNPQLPAFSPLGFWVDEVGGVTLLTHFEQSVQSLDNLSWDTTNERSGVDYDLFDALQKSALILARLHMLGFAHGDAQIKNMAHDTDGRMLRLIDLTTLRQVHDPKEPRPIEWQQAVMHDLKRLVSTVRERGYLYAENAEVVRDLVYQGLLSVHASLLRHPSSQDYLFAGCSQMLDEITLDILDQLA